MTIKPGRPVKTRIKAKDLQLEDIPYRELGPDGLPLPVPGRVSWSRVLDNVATQAARSLFRISRVPAPELRPAQAARFPGYMRRHCDRMQEGFVEAGYRVLGDFETTELADCLGQRVLVRCFLSPTERACAIAFAFRPRAVGWRIGPWRGMLARWRTVRVVECQTEFEQGGFLVTRMAGPSPGPWLHEGGEVQHQWMPLSPSAATVLSRHAKARAARKVRRMHSFDDVVAMQARLQQARNAHRQHIGYATDEELRLWLGPHYPSVADKVRFRLTTMARALPDLSESPPISPSTSRAPPPPR
jgi:hypothetical protein